MFICFLGARSNLSRLFTFACLFVLIIFVQYSSSASSTDRSISSTIKSVQSTKSERKTNQTKNVYCVPEIIDETLYYFSKPYRIFAGALVVPITICAIFGNILVIYVIKHYRNLRITGNVFLASLAVADVGVSTLAMTFYGLQLLQGRWIFGAFMCRLWFSCDVLFSTASIMHLAGIALDRYLSIVRPFDHDRTSSERRRYLMIFTCWFVSALLSFIPIFTGIYTTREQREKINCLNHVHGRCVFAVNQAYAIVSSSFSFWVPGAAMIIIYLMLIRIADKKEREAYQMIDAVAQRRRASQLNQYATRRRSSEEPTLLEPGLISQRDFQLTTNGHDGKLRRQSKHDSLATDISRLPSVDLSGGALDSGRNHMKHLRRERRAVKTLGAIMVAFIICWLPFFIRYSACEPDRCNWKIMPLIADIVFWVGYFNSMINPFLYAFHNRDFSQAFEKTLTKYFVCCRRKNSDPRSSVALSSTTLNQLSKKKSEKKKKKDKSNGDNPRLSQTLGANIGNTTVRASNGFLTSRENSFSSRCQTDL